MVASGGTSGWASGGTSGWSTGGTSGGTSDWTSGGGASAGTSGPVVVAIGGTSAGAGLERLRPQSFSYLFVVSFRRGWLVGWSLTSQVNERHSKM